MSITFASRRSWLSRQAPVRPAPPITPSTLRVRANQITRPWLFAERDVARRVLNIAVATVGIVITSPLMLVIALAVRLTSKGPVIFKQPRVGVDRRAFREPGSGNRQRRRDLGGRIFTMYKFRTMRPEQGRTGHRWAAAERHRITPVGRILRAFRLDELPQLFNVLKGDMNIVGPRPEQPEIFADLRQEVGFYRDRQRVLPGITGLAQVSLGYDQTVDDVKKKVHLDLQYMKGRSAAKDLVIMAKTMPVMVFRRGSM